MKIGEVIRAERLRREWSQEFLAARAGVSRKHLGALERDEANVSVGVLERVVRALDLKQIPLGQSVVDLASTTEQLAVEVEAAFRHIAAVRDVLRMNSDVHASGEQEGREPMWRKARRQIVELLDRLDTMPGTERDAATSEVLNVMRRVSDDAPPTAGDRGTMAVGGAKAGRTREIIDPATDDHAAAPRRATTTSHRGRARTGRR